MFDEVYNIVPSPFTGIVYSTLQTKDLERMQKRYMFYEAVVEVEGGLVRAYDIDVVANVFLKKPAFYELWYRVKDGILTPEADRVVVEFFFSEMKFLSKDKRNLIVSVDGEIVRALVGVDYRDIIFVLSVLSMKYPVVIHTDTKNVLEFGWGMRKVRFEMVDYIPFVCRVCGNVKNFSVREDLLEDVILECPEHGYMRENALYLRGEDFFGWRFFDSFSPAYLLGDLYGITVWSNFKIGKISFSFVELPEYRINPPVFVRGENGQLEEIEKYLQ